MADDVAANVSGRRSDMSAMTGSDGLVGQSAPASVAAIARSPGRPLASAERARLAPHLGGRISEVRIHDDARAAAAARDIGARAFAVGPHIGFAAGQYRPGTADGLALLAHEVAHAVQPGPPDIVRRSPDPRSVEAALERSKRGLMMEPSEMCGPGGCYDSSEIDAQLAKSRADDAAAEARATAERKRRRDIRATGTKQAKWRLKWETDPDIYRLEGIGNVPGTRDDGIMTPVGVRVPAYPGDYLSPRPFYEREASAFLAWQGFVHYAEIVEAGHDAAARDMSLKMMRGYPIPDNMLDLYQYTGWSKQMHDTRETVQATLTLAEGIQAVNSAIAATMAARSAVAEFGALFGGLLKSGKLGEVTVEGVAFGGVEARVVDGELFVSYSHIKKVSDVSGAGRAAHGLFEEAAQLTAKSMGLSKARVGVSNVINQSWKGFLESQQYYWGTMPNNYNGVTGYWMKTFNVTR